MKVTNLKKGDVLSESSHYVVQGVNGTMVRLTHFESNTSVDISSNYVENYLKSGDLFDRVIEVTKEDKKDGTKGIRSIFEEIYDKQVFTVCFKKQDKKKTGKKLQEEIDAVVNNFVAGIERVKTQKKGVAKAAEAVIKHLVENPILPNEEGEDRILRGYKIQFTSRDGRYDCVDMDIEKTEKESAIRPVNINTIKWIIINSTKYVVK